MHPFAVGKGISSEYDDKNMDEAGTLGVRCCFRFRAGRLRH